MYAVVDCVDFKVAFCHSAVPMGLKVVTFA